MKIKLMLIRFIMNFKKLYSMKTLNLLFSLLLLFALSTQTLAQEGPPFGAEKREKLESMKIAFLTKRLDLSPEEARNFWPVYNQMSKEIEVIRKGRRHDLRNAREEFSDLTDKEVEKLVDNEIAFRQNELDIIKKYHGQFKQVLPVKKVALLYKSEEDFKRHLLTEIRNKGRSGPGN